MSHRSVEIIIGRLVTDEAFRSAFRGDAKTTVIGFAESGYALTSVEVTALRATPVDVWDQVAAYIDPRLQKVSFIHTEE